MTTAAQPTASLRIAIVCFAIWLAAVLGAGAFGLWITVGGVSVVLGGVVLATNYGQCWPALHPTWRSVVLGTVVGAAMAAATRLGYLVLAGFAPFVAHDTAHLYSAFRAPSATLSAVALTPIIVGEELVWRHVVQGGLVRRFGPRWGAVAAVLAYAAVLVPLRSPVMVLAALGCGMVWTVLRATTRGLVAPLVAHLVWDAVVLIFLPLDGGVYPE